MGDITGIVKNALERGWQKNEIIQSLANTGYTQQEIESEIQSLISSSNSASGTRALSSSQTLQQVTQSSQTSSQKIEIPSAPQNLFNPQSLKNYQIPQLEKPKEVPTYVIVILIALLIVTIIGAGLFFFL